MNVTVINSADQPTAAERLQNKITNIVQKNISKSEIRKYMAMEDLEDRNLSIAMLYILYKDFNFNENQLKEFYLKSSKAFDDAADYTLRLEDVPEAAALEKIGINVEAFQKDYLIGTTKA